MGPPLLTPGTRVGRYEVVAHLAGGGMGEVYRARDTELGRDVALKVLAGTLADHPAAVERFRREARAAARLSHKNIVTLYDWGQDGDVHFLALEFVDGRDLASRIARKGRLRPAEALAITAQAARALDHAFAQGITHRDVKPGNLLISRRGRRLRVKLADFGLATVAGDEGFRITRDGSTVGTVDYLAPEQARDSSAADIRSDIYSLGCTLYHMLAGWPPFPDGGLGERVLKHQQVEPPDVRLVNPAVPTPLWLLLKQMLAKRPGDRFQTPTELLDALRRIKDAEPTLAVPGPEDVDPGESHSPPSRSTQPTRVVASTPSEIADVPRPRRKPSRVERLRKQARAAEWHKDLGKAIALWKAVQKARPHDPEAPGKIDALLRRLAQAYEQQGDLAQALLVWQTIHKVRPDDAEAARRIKHLTHMDANPSGEAS
jgi:serine/threonine protein kinase